MRGRVKAIDVAGRWGFIARRGEKGPDVYFRADDLACGLVFSRKLMQQLVQFDLQIRGTRVKAINFRLATDDPAGRAAGHATMGTDAGGNCGSVPADSGRLGSADGVEPAGRSAVPGTVPGWRGSPG